jgi:hypothetical protein
MVLCMTPRGFKRGDQIRGEEGNRRSNARGGGGGGEAHGLKTFKVE